MPLTPTTYATLTAMITPAIFMTANASLIISTSNRVSRVVDRMRVMNDHADTLDRGITDLDFVAERLDHFHEQIAPARATKRPAAVCSHRACTSHLRYSWAPA